MSTAVVTRINPKDMAKQFGPELVRDATKRGITVSQLLERHDPTTEYPKDSEDRQLDAFERVMRAEELITSPIDAIGLQASTWEEATSTSNRRAIMHEFCCRIWRQTAHRPATMTPQTRAILLSGDAAINSLLNPYTDDDTIHAKRLVPPVPLSEIVARTVPISTDGYRSLYITDDFGTDGYRMKRVGEGSGIPTTTLVTGEHTLRIGKFGRALRSTYEQLRRQRIDRIAFIVARMALQAEVDKVSIALGILVSGDGNANTAATVYANTALDAAASAGTLTLKAWLTFKARFTLGYVMTTVLAQEASTLQLLLLPVNTVNGTPLAFLGTNNFGDLTAMAQRLAGGVRYGITADAPALDLVAFDNSTALERVVEIGGNVSEVERFIHNQTQLLTMTEVEGYGIIDPNATKVLNING